MLLERLKKEVPPVVLIDSFLGPDLVRDLLLHALDNKSSFEPAPVRRNEQIIIDPDVRNGRRFGDLGRFNDRFTACIRTVLASVLTGLGISAITDYKLEAEMIWNGDGGVFKRHTDTLFYAQRGLSERVVSMVYYFHMEPKAFTGGQIRLYPLAPPAEDIGYREIEPLSDRLICFPSWYPHEVLPTISPSGLFEDGRFSINCWVHKVF